MRRSATVLAVVVAALALAAAALAATPSKGLHRGHSSQGEPVDVKVGSDHRVSRFRIDWSAHCDSDQYWDFGTTVKDPAHQPEEGSFRGEGKYSDPDAHGGFRGHYWYRVTGKFTSKRKAHGTFEIRVRVTKSGVTKDHCHKKVTWRVS